MTLEWVGSKDYAILSVTGFKDTTTKKLNDDDDIIKIEKIEPVSVVKNKKAK